MAWSDPVPADVEVLTTRQAVDRSGMALVELYRRIDEGQIRAWRFGTREERTLEIVISAEDVDGLAD